jgi:hypothetical protein
MKGHQLAGEAGRRAPAWYLARGHKRYGPLADRELLLLAERGGLHSDDLLWKPGFISWRSVHAVCGANASHSNPSIPPHDAEYLPTREVSGGLAEIADVADVSETLKPKAVERCRTDQIQTTNNSGLLDDFQVHKAECILRERELTPDGKLARGIHNNSAAWTLAFSLGTFIVALGIFWLIATGYRLP